MDWSQILQLAVPAATSVAGAAIGSHAAGNAAATQSKAAQDAIALQREIFNRQQQNLQPWLTAGNAGLQQLMRGMGIRTPAPSYAPAPMGNYGSPPSGGNPNVLGVQPPGTLSKIGSIGGDAATGATIGSFVPGIGTAIGAGVGAAYGGVRSLLGTAHLNANNFVQNVENPFTAVIKAAASGQATPQQLQQAYQTYMQGVSQYQQAGGNNALVANQSLQKNPQLWQTFNNVWSGVSGGQPSPASQGQPGSPAQTANMGQPGASPAQNSNMGTVNPDGSISGAQPNAMAQQNSNMRTMPMDANGNPVDPSQATDPSQSQNPAQQANANPQDPNADPNAAVGFGQFNQTFDATKDPAAMAAMGGSLNSLSGTFDPSKDPGYNPAYADVNHPFTMSDFQADPGYQFRMDQGNEAIQRNAAAKGILNSGGTLKALDQYNQNYASNEFQNAYGRFNNERGNAQGQYNQAFGRFSNQRDYAANQYNDAYNRFTQSQNNQFNRFATVAGIGQTATGQANQVGANYGNNVSDLLTGQGNAVAAGQAASGAAWTGGLNAGANGISNYFANQNLNNAIRQSGYGPQGTRSDASTGSYS